MFKVRPLPQLLGVRPLLPVLQDGGHAEEHHLLLRHVAARGRVHGTVGQQGHVERDQGRHGQRPLPALLHEVQGGVFIISRLAPSHDNETLNPRQRIRNNYNYVKLVCVSVCGIAAPKWTDFAAVLVYVLEMDLGYSLCCKSIYDILY